MRTQNRRPIARGALWTWLAALMLVLPMIATVMSPVSAQDDGGMQQRTAQVRPDLDPDNASEDEGDPLDGQVDDPLDDPVNGSQDDAVDDSQGNPVDGSQDEPVDDALDDSEDDDESMPPGDNGEDDDDGMGTMNVSGSPTSWANRFLICPPGTDLVNGDPATLEGACVLPGIDVTYVLSQGTSVSTFPINQPGAYAFFFPLPGEATVTLNPAPAAFAVFCEAYDDHGNTRPYARALVASPSVMFDVAEGERIACTWFLGSQEAGGSLTLYKWVCPMGVDPAVDPGECAAEMPGVPFNLVDGNGSTPFTSDTNGRQLDDIVPDVNGMFTVSEDLPMGYLAPAVYCQNNAEDPQPSAPALVPVTNGAISMTPTTPVFEYQCFWYNVPDPSPSTITIRKWNCPVGYDVMVFGADPKMDCTQPVDGIPFVLSDNDPSSPDIQTSTGDSMPGAVVFGGTEPGQVTITEQVPPKTASVFLWQCEGMSNGSNPAGPLNSGPVWDLLLPGGLDITCDWYNVPEESPQAGAVTIYKWECPQDQMIDPTLAAHQAACTQPMDGVTFTLDDGMGARSMTTSGGMIQWTDVRVGVFTVTETVPSGYSTQPYVACDFASQNNLPISYAMVNNVLTATLNHDGQKIDCHWFNQYIGPGEIIVYKWTCPEGYDWTAWGADPKADCATATNGVTFVLNQPSGMDLQSDTGDSIDGAVRFGDLDPGTYVMNEIVPDGISDVFVLDCTGLNTGSVHPVPLSIGPALPMRIAAGDMIRCNWYNVPQPDPQYGWLTVTKYTCWTTTYVRDIDCEIYEGGKDFELQLWNGTAWTKAAAGTTNKAGQVTWTSLAPGTYRAVEQGGTACKVIANPADGDGNAVVKAKAGTMVKVYNCGVAPSPESKMPTKYPTTGVDPAAFTPSSPFAPGVSILGALGVTGTAMSRRSFLRRSLIASVAVGSGGFAVRHGFAGQAIEPIGTAVATPGEDCLYPATPAAGVDPAGTPVACARGAVPVRIAIEAIGVDAEIEVLEIVAGEMEQPTGAEDVAWYKETARLGERGNILLAGHLNFWGVPEGVFFALGQLKEGDVVDLQGEDDETYRYIVQWTEDFPSDEEPPEEVLGQTEEQAITMITCGGEWIADRSEYDHRTLVRAIRDSEHVPSTPVT